MTFLSISVPVSMIGLGYLKHIVEKQDSNRDNVMIPNPTQVGGDTEAIAVIFSHGPGQSYCPQV